jgi:hypothetical protein
MRRILFVLASAVAVVGMTAAVALADSPSFHYANASVSSSTGALSVDFKLTGLGTGVSTVSIQLNASASATYQCFNNGGNHPKAGNKTTVAGPIAQGGTFPVRNGQVTNTITAGPLSPGSFSCPSGQTRYLQDVSYSAISVQTPAGTSTPTAILQATPSQIALSGFHIPA